MKIRIGLVSNSSSSSFLLDGNRWSLKTAREAVEKAIQAYNILHPDDTIDEGHVLAFITSRESDHCPKCDHHTTTIEVAMAERAPNLILSILSNAYGVVDVRSQY